MFYIVYEIISLCYIVNTVAPHTDLSPQEPKNDKMLLSGYGVELAIKSTEYKAVADTQVKGIIQCQIAFCVTKVLK